MAKTIDEDRKERKAKGQSEVIDGQGGGFAQHDDEFSNPALDEYLKQDTQLAKELSDIENRQHDIKPSNQHIEAAHSAFEFNMNMEAVREAQWLNQDEITSFVPGEMMNCNQFIMKLKKIRPDAELQPFTILGRRGITVINPRTGNPYFVTTIQDGMMIEWSQMRVDEHNVPTNERYRGFRTALMTLIERMVVTSDEVDKIFGKPNGPRADRWYRMLKTLQTGRCAKCGYSNCICKGRYDHFRAENYAYGKVQ